jgi:CO/xanthine dehydrogenase Mo-binding subunit
MKNVLGKVRDNHARLLRGRGRYLDDIDVRDCLHVAFARSSVANAQIREVRVAAALAFRGVELVLTAADLGSLNRPLPLLRAHPDITHPKTQAPLAHVRVSYVGQPIVMVVAASRYEAEDAAALIEIDYDPLPPVPDMETALIGERLVHDDVPGNLAGRMERRRGDPDRAFAEAPFTEKLSLRVERSCGSPMEGRGVLASWDERQRRLEVWDSTQNPIAIHHGLARLLGLADTEIRVAAPDVGGGFGTKIMMFYPEEVLIPFAAMRLGRAIKWVEDRWEHLVSANQERGQIHEAEVAFDAGGKILAVRTEFVHDNGAFAPYGPSVPEVTMTHVTGQYAIAHFHAQAKLVYTNTPCVTPYRGAGRPQAAFVMERLISVVARRLGKEPLEVRRLNLIPASAFPYDTGLTVLGTDMVYDSGNYQAAFETMDRELPLAAFRDRQTEAREACRYLGIGFSTYIEGSAPGPYETARCVLDSSGKVKVVVSPPSQGQSHETVFGNLVAETLGVDPSDVVFVAGDSAQVRSGTGTFGSRAAVYVGNAVVNAARALRRQIIDYMAGLLDIAPESLEIEAGRIYRKGDPDNFFALSDIVAARNTISYVEESGGTQYLRAILAKKGPGAHFEPRGPGWPEFEAQENFSANRLTYGSGMHGCVVAVDVNLGTVSILDYVVVDDCGVVLDHATVHGQVAGGVAQGIGGALLERLVFDQEAQPLSSTLMTFLLPTIHDVPRIRIVSVETPSPVNPLGIKGVGEAGVIAVAAAIAEAIDDALKGLAVPVTAMPIFPEQVLRLINDYHNARTQ